MARRKKENNREVQHQWSREQAEKSLHFFKKHYDKTNDTELKCDLLEKITQLTTELLGLSSVQPDSEEWEF